MKLKFLGTVGVLAVAAIALSACSGGSTPDANPKADESNPFHFVYVGGVTGALATLSTQEIAALENAVDEVNDEGGINGRKVEMEVLDSKSDPTEAVSVLQKRLAQSPKPDLVRAGLPSGEALAMLPVLTRAGIPSFSAAASPLLDDVKSYPYNLLVSAKFARVLEITRTYVEYKKYKTLAVLAPEDASGDANVAAAEATYKGSDVKVNIVRYNPADLDLSVAYQRAIADKPDVVYANCLGAPCVRVVAARLSVAGGTDIPMLGDTSMSGAAGGPAASNPPEAIENLSVVMFDGQIKHAADNESEVFTKFYDGLEKKLGSVPSISSPSVAYDGFRAWATAFNTIKSTDAKKGFAEISKHKWPAGFFATYGNAAVDYIPTSNFPQLPDNAFVVSGVTALEGGLYPGEDVFAPKVK